MFTDKFAEFLAVKETKHVKSFGKELKKMWTSLLIENACRHTVLSKLYQSLFVDGFIGVIF